LDFSDTGDIHITSGSHMFQFSPVTIGNAMLDFGDLIVGSSHDVNGIKVKGPHETVFPKSNVSLASLSTRHLS